MEINYDESGSITLSNHQGNRYFVIAGCSTGNPQKVKRVFRKAKRNYLKHNPDLNLDIRSEIKGSQMNSAFKEYIFSELRQKTDIKFNFIVFDNMNAYENLRNKPSITYNYLMFLQISKILSDRNLLLNLDDRNVAIRGMKSLEDYLLTKLCIEEDILDDLSVKFYDSKNHNLIQIADIFSNHVYRIVRAFSYGHDNSKELSILDSLSNNISYSQYFPASKCEFEEIFKK